MSKLTIPRCVVLVLGVLTGGDAGAITSGRIKALPLVIEENSRPDGLLQLGSVGRYLAALARARNNCRLAPYEYGAVLTCRRNTGQMVILDLRAEPTRSPEFVRIAQIRPDGINSDPVATAAIPAFLNQLCGLK